MRLSSDKPHPWEVWLAYVRFADHPCMGMIRPVVILGGRTAAVIAAKTTSASLCGRFHYRELPDWEEEGLLRPSRVQIAPPLIVGDGELLRGEPLGTLSDRDRETLRGALSQGRE